MSKEINNVKIKSKVVEEQELAHTFYKEALALLVKSGAKFLVGGGFALDMYTGIKRATKDLDVFCKAGECPRILKTFAESGYDTQMTDARWLGKAKKGENLVDLIFNNPGSMCPVDDRWFEHAVEGELYGVKLKFMPAEELIWCKLYVQNRERYDGSDINHILLRYGDKLNWNRLWVYTEQHWQLLLAQFLSFQFVYPSERDIIPRWLMDELLLRAREQYEVETPVEKICRGPFIDQTQYAVDITEWDYKVVTIRTI
ncbi:nucleotidyltransferase [Pontibacter sp. HJ8]